MNTCILSKNLQIAQLQDADLTAYYYRFLVWPPPTFLEPSSLSKVGQLRHDKQTLVKIRS